MVSTKEREQPEGLTAQQVADRWQFNPRTVRRWAAEGRLPAVRLGPKSLRFKVADVQAFIENGYVEA